MLLRPPTTRLLRVNVADRLSIVDWGDAPTVPATHSSPSNEPALPSRRSPARGIVTLCLGGDHTGATGRAPRARSGPRLLWRSSSSIRTTISGTSTWAEDLPRERRQAGRRGRADRPGAVDPSRAARIALRARRRRVAGAARDRRAVSYEELAALGRTSSRCRVRNEQDRRMLSSVRYRFRRPGVRAGNRNARGRRADEPRGAHLRPLPRRPRLQGLRLRGSSPAYEVVRG